jgi:hypothetical protein
MANTAPVPVTVSQAADSLVVDVRPVQTGGIDQCSPQVERLLHARYRAVPSVAGVTLSRPE